MQEGHNYFGFTIASFQIHGCGKKDNDIPHALMSILTLLGKVFSIREADNNEAMFGIFPKESLVFSIYLLTSQTHVTVSMESLKRAVIAALLWETSNYMKKKKMISPPP